MHGICLHADVNLKRFRLGWGRRKALLHALPLRPLAVDGLKFGVTEIIGTCPRMPVLSLDRDIPPTTEVKIMVEIRRYSECISFECAIIDGYVIDFNRIDGVLLVVSIRLCRNTEKCGYSCQQNRKDDQPGKEPYYRSTPR